ncbi:MAG: aminotransferase class III-fold pyridoxal phosphate-dependent enzyme [Haloarculaceae archaeon]
MDRATAEPQVTELPGERAREWVEYHHESAAISTHVYDFVWDFTADAEGPFCTDADGNVLLDFTSHVAAAPLGYDNPKLMERLEAFDLVDPVKMAGQDFYAASGPLDDHEIPTPADLMARLTDRTAHYGMDTVFLSNSGAEAVENALKICYDYREGKYGVTFEGAFHGRTLGTLSLNRSKEIYRRSFPVIPSVHDAPYCTDRTCTPETCECGFFAGGTSKLRRMLDPERGYVNPDELAYVIVEPMQGEGGYRFPSDAFMDEVATLVQRYDVTLIADEIQTGLGRSGEWWLSDHYAIEPDVITSAKGLRVGATVSREEIFPSEESRLSSTWGAGDILSSAVGALTIDVIDDYDLVANATERGRQAVESLRDADLPGVVDVRGKGLLLAVEFDSKDRRDGVMEAALKRGLLTLGCGQKTIRLLPPLDATEREIELGVALLGEAASAVA